MDLKKLVSAVMVVIVFIALNVRSYTLGEEFSNVIKVQSRKVLWLYRSRLSKPDNYVNSTLVMKPLGIEHQIESHTNLSVSHRAILNVSYVFIGNERLFYQFTYATPNVSISIDSNIVVDKEYVLVQWYSVKTGVRVGSANTSLRYIQINNRIEEVIKKFNLSMIEKFNALMTVLQTKTEVNEYINIYDLYINKTKYLGHLASTSSAHICSRFDRIPMHTWIEVNEVVGNGNRIIKYRIESIDTDEILLITNSLSCMIPILGTINDVIENLEVDTLFLELGIRNELNLMNKITKEYREYIIKGVEVYIPIAYVATNRYNVTKFVIEIHHLLNSSGILMSISVNNMDGTIFNEDHVRNLLADIVAAYETVYHYSNTIDWRNIINVAGIIELYTNTTNSDAGSTSNPSELTVLVVVTLASVTIQAVIILFVILKIFKRIR